VIYLLTAVGLSPGGSCTVHSNTQTINRTTQNKQYIEQHKFFENNTKILEECGPCTDLVIYTLTFALQLRKKHGKTSVRVVEQVTAIRRKQGISRTKGGEVFLLSVKNEGSFACVIRSLGVQM
jgi:hypothetical protein